MTGQSHLTRRGARYSARIRVPLDLVDIVGKDELTKALGTTELAEAKRRLWPLLDSWQREFDDLRARRVLTPADQAFAVWDHYTGALDRDEAERAQLPGEEEIAAAEATMIRNAQTGELDVSDKLAVLAATLNYRVTSEALAVSATARQIKLADLRKHLAKGETALIDREVDHYLRRQGLFAEPGTPGWISFARAMMRAEIEALERALERDGGDYTGTPRDPIVKPASGTAREVAKPGEGIMDIFEIFASENPRGVALDRVNQCRRDIATFVDMVGPRFPIAKIDKAAVRDWKQLLVKYPVKATETKAFAGMNIRQTVAANEKVGKPVIADRTVNRYLSGLSAFLTWAENNGYLDRNPVEGLMLKKETKTPTVPFKTDQLNALFRSPWFTGCQSDTEWRNVSKPGNVLIRDHRFWVPLAMLYSGARPGEIAQLAVNDVREAHGRWIFHITTEGDDHEQGKSVKTAGSMRVVPVHPELIRLGFIRYHQKRQAEGGAQLFPGAVRNERGQIMTDVSREFGRYLTKIGLKQGRGLSLYSFRHGATDALRRAGFLDQEFGFILGHTEATMTGKYGQLKQGMLDQRVKLIEGIQYQELDLSHLYPQGG